MMNIDTWKICCHYDSSLWTGYAKLRAEISLPQICSTLSTHIFVWSLFPSRKIVAAWADRKHLTSTRWICSWAHIGLDTMTTWVGWESRPQRLFQCPFNSPWICKQQGPPKSRYHTTSLHDVTIQKAAVNTILVSQSSCMEHKASAVVSCAVHHLVNGKWRTNDKNCNVSVTSPCRNLLLT
jgi:hypothetical protein